MAARHPITPNPRTWPPLRAREIRAIREVETSRRRGTADAATAVIMLARARLFAFVLGCVAIAVHMVVHIGGSVGGLN